MLIMEGFWKRHQFPIGFQKVCIVQTPTCHYTTLNFVLRMAAYYLSLIVLLIV